MSALGFNGLDRETGYAVRFDLSRRGWWWSSVNAFPAWSTALTLRTARVRANEAIHIHLEHAIENGLPIPEPERKETPLDIS